MRDENRVRLLLVEDNHADAELMRVAFAEIVPTLQLERVTDGELALARLRSAAPPTGVALPALMLLDLNLPRVHGKEVLAAIRGDPAYRHLPVLVLTTSTSEQDVLDCYRLGANAYLIKPVGYAGILNMVRRIAGFWLELAILPGGKN